MTNLQNNFPGQELQRPQPPQKLKRKSTKTAGIITGSVLSLTVLVGVLVGCGSTSPDEITGPATSPVPTAPAEPKAPESPAKPEMTRSQEQAVRAAENYIQTMPFSKKGLIEQLVYEQFSEADATFAVNHIDVDWKEQAVKAAQNYLDTMPFSQADLIDQLKYDGFTQAQAEHGAAVAFSE